MRKRPRLEAVFPSFRRLWLPRKSFPLGTEAKVARSWKSKIIRRRANATEHLNGGVRRQHTHTPIQIRSSDDWRTAPNTFIIERYRDTFTPVDCGRATNQVHRPKVKREKIQVPKCIRLIDKTRHYHQISSSAAAAAAHEQKPPILPATCRALDAS